MLFLYPSFLFALISLLIPVFIHLFNFRRYKKVYFSNVQFLREVQERQSSAKNLKERLVLVARLATITFLVFAFAKPYLPGQNAKNAGKKHVVSVFVDNSYSMQTLNPEGSLLDEAKTKAKEIVSAYGVNDRFQLLTHDFEGKHQRLLNRDEFNDAVDTVKISPQSRNLQQIIGRQESLLKLNKNDLNTIYIISDFQKNIAGNQSIKIDSGTAVNLVQLKATPMPNVAVDSVILLSAIHRPGDPEKIVIKLHNYADETAKKIPVKLIINGKQKALGSYTVNPRAIQSDTLSFSGLEAGWQEGEVSLQDNPVTFDNNFYFSFNVKSNFNLLLIDNGVPNPFLKAVFATEPFFKVSRSQEGNIDYSALNTYPQVILSDINTIPAGLAQQLKTYVEKGGVLLIFPGSNPDLLTYKTFLNSVVAAYPEKLVTDNTKVSKLNLKNPVFKGIFEDYPQNPDLPAVKKYFNLISPTASRSETLMELPGNQTFWSEFLFKKGKVLLAAVPLDEEFSNLPKHGLFLPVMFRIAFLSGHDLPLFYTLGSNESIEIPPIQLSTNQILKLNKNKQTIIPDTRQSEGSTLIYLGDQVQETGIYKLKLQDSTVAELAFNDSRSESNLSYLEKNDLQRIVPNISEYIVSDKNSLKEQITETNFGTQLWKLCIILALIFLAFEILLIRNFNTTRLTK